MSKSSIDLGKIGEYICVLRMLQNDLSASIVNLETVDVIVHDDGKMWRVQVKASTLKKHGIRSRGYQFNLAVGGKRKRSLTPDDCDIIALVALEHQQVMFYSVHSVQGMKTRRISPKKFDDPDVCLKSWLRAVSHHERS